VITQHDNKDSKKQTTSLVKINGKFEKLHVPERNLIFGKRFFANVDDYIRELEMIKHRHLNILTPEAIFKILKDDNYYLLYDHSEEPISLEEYINENTINQNVQLTILRDVSCALVYLHETMVHGNLNTKNILISNRNNRIFPKIFNFSEAKNRAEYSNEEFTRILREEIIRFGLIFFPILSSEYKDENSTREWIKLFHENSPSEDKKEEFSKHSCEFSTQYNIEIETDIGDSLLRLYFKLTDDKKPIVKLDKVNIKTKNNQKLNDYFKFIIIFIFKVLQKIE
jgi:hypothetical protein